MKGRDGEFISLSLCDQVNRVYSPMNTIKQGADFESERILGQFIVNRAERKIIEIDEFE